MSLTIISCLLYLGCQEFCHHRIGLFKAVRFQLSNHRIPVRVKGGLRLRYTFNKRRERNLIQDG